MDDNSVDDLIRKWMSSWRIEAPFICVWPVCSELHVPLVKFIFCLVHFVMFKLCQCFVPHCISRHPCKLQLLPILSLLMANALRSLLQTSLRRSSSLPHFQLAIHFGMRPFGIRVTSPNQRVFPLGVHAWTTLLLSQELSYLSEDLSQKCQGCVSSILYGWH